MADKKKNSSQTFLLSPPNNGWTRLQPTWKVLILRRSSFGKQTEGSKWNLSTGWKIWRFKTTDALPGEFPYLRGTKKNNNEWLVRQEIKGGMLRKKPTQTWIFWIKGCRFTFFPCKSKELNAEYIETLLNDILSGVLNWTSLRARDMLVELPNLLVAYFQKKIMMWKKLQGSIRLWFL